MLEQTKLNGPIYASIETTENGKAKLATKNATIANIAFGPALEIIIHRNPDTDGILLEIPTGESTPPRFGFYKDEKYVRELTVTDDQMENDETFSYYYGHAIYDGKEMPYYIKNQPSITATCKPSLSTFRLPSVIGGYPYKQTFSYLPELVSLLSDYPTTFTDRYKRPLRADSVRSKRYYPVSMDAVKTTFAELANTNYPFPLVAMLSTAHGSLGCIDLEPGYNQDDLSLAESFPAYYVEDTPRGGRHYLVKIDSELAVFKYRLTDNLEAQINSQITFYGINGKWLNDDPEVADFSSYKVVGRRTSIEVTAKTSEEMLFASRIVDELVEANERLGTTGVASAKRVYAYDKDESHADFTAMARLYRTNVLPFKSNIAIDMLPWVLAEYAARVIPARLKHSDDRLGVPYLVYLASKII